MKPDFSERVKELQLLGWSENGAEIYTENIDNNNRIFLSLNNLNLIILLSAIFLFIFISLLAYIFISKNKSISENLDKSDLSKNKNNLTNLIKNEQDFNKVMIDPLIISTKSTLKTNSTSNYFKDVVTIFKITSIDTDIIVQHLLLIIFIFVEILFSVIKLIYELPLKGKTYYEKELLSPEKQYIPDFEERKEFKDRRVQLFKMKNIELKNFLRGTPNISRLNKSKLVEMILEIEFTKINNS